MMVIFQTWHFLDKCLVLLLQPSKNYSNETLTRGNHCLIELLRAQKHPVTRG